MEASRESRERQEVLVTVNSFRGARRQITQVKGDRLGIGHPMEEADCRGVGVREGGMSWQVDTEGTGGITERGAIKAHIITIRAHAEPRARRA